MRKKHLKESTIMDKRIFDFTHDDPEEDVFPSTVVKFNLMELTTDEVQELGIPFKNSLYGAYGLYRSGNGVPEVVVCDYETRRPVYTYKIAVYQIQPTDDFEEIAEHFGKLLEFGGLVESTETKVELNEAAKYKAPEDPFLKFRSDLARELTAKHFPVWSYHKSEKKMFRSPMAILNDGRLGGYDYTAIILRSFGSDQLAVEVGHSNGIACIVESEGQGEEYFQNTNSAIPSEGYKTTDNFFYQGPTWRVKGCDDYKAKDFLKEGLTRNQIADAIIECLKLACPDRDFDNEWNELVAEIDAKIKDREAYVKEYTAKLEADPSEVDSGDGAWKDEWFRGRIQKGVNAAAKFVKELSEALQEPALCPEYLNSDSGTTTDRKSRTWFGGTWTATYDGRTEYWVTAAWTKPEAIRKMKQSYSCSRRASTGCSKEPAHSATSVKCTKQFTSAEEAQVWKEDNFAWYEG